MNNRKTVLYASFGIAALMSICYTHNRVDKYEKLSKAANKNYEAYVKCEKSKSKNVIDSMYMNDIRIDITSTGISVNKTGVIDMHWDKENNNGLNVSDNVLVRYNELGYIWTNIKNGYDFNLTYIDDMWTMDYCDNAKEQIMYIEENIELAYIIPCISDIEAGFIDRLYAKGKNDGKEYGVVFEIDKESKIYDIDIYQYENDS